MISQTTGMYKLATGADTALDDYAALLVEEAELDGRLRWTADNVRDRQAFDISRNDSQEDSRLFGIGPAFNTAKGQDVGVVSRHADLKDYVDPVKRLAAEYGVTEEYVRQATMADLRRVDAAKAEMRAKYGDRVKDLEAEWKQPKPGGSLQERVSASVNGVPVGLPTQSTEAAARDFVGRLGDTVERWENKFSLLPDSKVSRFLAKFHNGAIRGLGEATVVYGAKGVDSVRDSAELRALNKAIEGRRFGNDKDITRSLNMINTQHMLDGSSGFDTTGATGAAQVALGATGLTGIGAAGKAIGAAKAVTNTARMAASGNKVLSTAGKLLEAPVRGGRAAKILAGTARFPFKTVINAPGYTALGVLASQGDVGMASRMQEQAEQQQSQPQQQTSPSTKPSAAPKPAAGGGKPWYKNPWVWLAGAGTLLGGGMLAKEWMDSRRRRREEDDYAARMAAVDAMRRNRAAAMQARRAAPPMVPYDYRQEQPITAGGWSGDDPFDFYTGDYYY